MTAHCHFNAQLILSVISIKYGWTKKRERELLHRPTPRRCFLGWYDKVHSIVNGETGCNYLPWGWSWVVASTELCRVVWYATANSKGLYLIGRYEIPLELYQCLPAEGTLRDQWKCIWTNTIWCARTSWQLSLQPWNPQLRYNPVEVEW